MDCVCVCGGSGSTPVPPCSTWRRSHCVSVTVGQWAEVRALSCSPSTISEFSSCFYYYKPPLTWKTTHIEVAAVHLGAIYLRMYMTRSNQEESKSEQDWLSVCQNPKKRNNKLSKRWNYELVMWQRWGSVAHRISMCVCVLQSAAVLWIYLAKLLYSLHLSCSRTISVRSQLGPTVCSLSHEGSCMCVISASNDQCLYEYGHTWI